MDAVAASPGSSPSAGGQGGRRTGGDGRTQGGPSAQTKTLLQQATSAPVLKSLAFLAVLIVIAALSTTVLQKPIEAGADWLRSAGLPGYFLLSSIGYVFLVLGGSATLFDVLCGFIYGAINGLIVGFVVKLLAACTCYAISRYLFFDYLRQNLFERYVWLEALEVMVREKPWQTISLIRLSVLPAAIKSYGMGALGAPFVPFVVTAIVTFAILSWVMADLGSHLTKPSQLFHAKSKSSSIVEMIGIIFALLALGLGAYYGRKYSQQIIESRQRDREVELRQQQQGGRGAEELEVMEVGGGASGIGRQPSSSTYTNLRAGSERGSGTSSRVAPEVSAAAVAKGGVRTSVRAAS